MARAVRRPVFMASWSRATVHSSSSKAVGAAAAPWLGGGGAGVPQASGPLAARAPPTAV